MKRLIWLCCISVSALVGFIGGAVMNTAHAEPPKFNGDQVVAQFGDTTVTRGELAEYAIAATGERLLQNDVQDITIVNELARKKGITASADEVETRIAEAMECAVTPQAKAELQSIPHWFLAEKMRTSILVEKLMNMTLSDNEVETFYVQNPQFFFHPAEVDLICIATDKRDTAKMVVNRLKEGEDPRQLASMYSTDKDLAKAKGELGRYSRKNMSIPVAEAIFDVNNGKGLQPKQCTDVLTNTDDAGKTNYMVFYVNDLTPSAAPPLDKIRTTVTFLARAQKFSKLAPEWFVQAAQSAGWKQLDLSKPNATLEVKPILKAKYLGN